MGDLALSFLGRTLAIVFPTYLLLRLLLLVLTTRPWAQQRRARIHPVFESQSPVPGLLHGFVFSKTVWDITKATEERRLG